MDVPNISIILPTLNEVEIDKKIDSLMPYIKSYPHEIIVVDDSSDDKFLALKNELADRKDIRLVKGDRRGKGAAVKKGALVSTGSIVFYIDADLRVPLDNIPVFIDLIAKRGYDLVAAQRPLDWTFRTPLRLFISFTLSLIVRLLVFHSTFFHDTQCGFKAFRGDVLRKFARKQTINGGMVDLEYLYMARANKLRIDKVAISPLPEIRPSRFSLWRSILNNLFDLLRIKIRGILGYYKEDHS